MPENPPNLTRIIVHERGLAIAHVAAFVGTGLTWLATDPHPRVEINRLTGHVFSGAYLFTFVSVLWVSWPYIPSFVISKARLPGKTSATWAFVCLLGCVAVGGGFGLRIAAASGAPMLFALAVATVEAALLTSGARRLGRHDS